MDDIQHSPNHGLRQTILILLVIIGIGATIAVYLFLEHLEHQRLENNFQQSAEEELNQIRQVMNNAVSLVEQVRVISQNDNQIDKQLFTTFGKTQQQQPLYPNQLIWAPKVALDDKKSFEQQARNGSKPLLITERNKEGKLVAVKERQYYYPVTYNVSATNNSYAYGFDLGSIALLNETIEQAEVSKKVTAVAFSTKSPDNKKVHIFQIIQPLFSQIKPDSKPEQKREIIGYIISEHHISELITVALKGLSLRGVHIEFIQIDAPPGQLSAVNGNYNPEEEGTAPLFSQLDVSDWRKDVTFMLAGHKWRLTGLPKKSFYIEKKNSTPLFISAVILFAALLTYTFMANMYRRDLGLQRIVSMLKKNQARLDEAQQLGGIGSWELDLTNYDLWWSDEVFRIFEVDPIDFTPTYDNFLSVVHPDDRETVDHTYIDSLNERTGLDIVHRLLLKNGGVKYIHLRGQTDFNEQGKPFRSIGNIHDITERHLAEQQLRFADDVFQHTADGIMITDAQGAIVAVNPAFTKITGYTPKEAMGRVPRLLRHDRRNRDYYRDLWDSLKERQQWTGEIWNRRKDGSVFPQLQTISGIWDEDQNLTHYVSVFTDISDIKQTQQELQYLAHHDPLTGLPNRLLFISRVEHGIARCKREGSHLALMYIDLDRFKNVNDSLGHPVGDMLLQQVAERFSEVVREDDTVARLGGDEFTILLEIVDHEEDAALVAQKLLHALDPPFHLKENKPIYIKASIGISIYPRDGLTPSTLLKNADAALYRTKAEGRNNYHFYSEELTQTAIDRFDLENALNVAIENEELQLYYQPQVRLSDGALVGAEALLRWNNPERGFIPPDRFIPLAEETGLIIPIGEWVLNTAAQQMKQWHDNGFELKHVAVNVAGPQIHHGDMVQVLQRVLETTELEPSRLELEITEGFIMNEPEQALNTLLGMRQQGIEMAIDDFGTGFSSLAYLKRLPISKLKIDKSFINQLPDNEEDAAIVNNIISLGAGLDFRVIAEGLETERQLHKLRILGCEEGQGYLFSKPLAADEFEEWCRDWEEKDTFWLDESALLAMDAGLDSDF